MLLSALAPLRQVFAVVILLCCCVHTAIASDPAGTCAGPNAATAACEQPEYPDIVIGCWQLLERHNDPDRAVETLRAYVDAGFTTFDTADICACSARRVTSRDPVTPHRYRVMTY